MNVHSSRADEQELGGQQAEPRDEHDAVKIYDYREGLLDPNAMRDLRHEPHEDSEPEQRDQEQKEITIEAPLIREPRRKATARPRNGYLGSSHGIPPIFFLSSLLRYRGVVVSDTLPLTIRHLHPGVSPAFDLIE